ncbi:MAG: hypothetical protein RhofKO_09440 [Rhodothermales bacterium]
MGLSYHAVGWNRQKRRYDLALWLGIVVYLGAFIGMGAATSHATIETLLIRGLGSGAFVLLHLILAIGPLSRLSPRFMALLYNRRHMGVSMFLLALGHGIFATIQFHTLGTLNPLVSILAGNDMYASISAFPFQTLGLLALLLLFMLAATSHDFWMANLTPPVWKALHMSVYVAYALLIGHVALGSLQAEPNPLLAGLTGGGLLLIGGLHAVAGWRERAKDEETEAVPDDQGFLDVCSVHDLREKRGHIVTVTGERVAIFLYDGKVSAVSNVCAHQNGPLGEGRIIDGCITCPWHGFQFDPANGRAPAPFTDKIPTFDVRLDGERVLVAAAPNLPGTPTTPAILDA